MEQRRSRKFLALVAVFLVVAILPSLIFFIITEVLGESSDAPDALDLMTIFLGSIGVFLGPLLTIMIMMGSLASERESGTAAMTLHKPVTRGAFVAAKIIGFAVAIFLAMALSAGVAYLLTLLVVGSADALRSFATAGIICVYLVFIGSIAFFWSSMLRSALFAGGLALATWITLHIVQGMLSLVPKAGRYLPVATPDWADSFLRGQTSNQWPAFLIALGCIAVLSVGAWAIFQRKEL